jgi:outer membrane protein OmpA-like peptidoglycan-associated protein
MIPKIKVYGKAMNRTALGIVNAYLKLYPKANLQDLKSAFPDDLYPEVEGGFFKTIKPLGVFQTKDIVDSLPAQGLQQPFFMNEDEIITLADGVEICVTKSWGKNALNRLADRAKEYGIVIAESTEGVAFKKGEYWLEELEGYKTHFVTSKPKQSYLIYYIGAAILIVGVVLYFLLKPSSDSSIPAINNKSEEVQDTLRFNNILFERNSAKIKDVYQEDLAEALKIMENNPDLNVLIVGHASQDQDDNERSRIYNINLSKERAESVKNWLVGKGIDPNRIKTDGRGYNNPIASNATEEGRKKNRRIEFIKR